MTETDIAVIGGGIAGASVAYHVSRKTDRSITVYERDELASETTAKSAAFFGFYGGAIERRMKRYGMELYNRLLAAPRSEPRYDLIGRIYAATSTETDRQLRRRAEKAISEAARPVRYLAADELKQTVFVPELEPESLEGALYRPHVGFMRPRELALEFAARARENGVSFETGTTVEEVTVEDGRTTGVTVDGTHVDADQVVCAAGPWNGRVARTAGVDLPVNHTLAPILKLDRDDHAGHTLPIISHEESGVYVRGHEEGMVLVGHYPTDENTKTEYDPADVSQTISEDTREEMWRVIDQLIPALGDADPVDEWVGVRSHTPDGNPIAGRTADEGFFVAAFNSSGIQLSPAVGRMIARQLVDEASTEYDDALSISRFEGYDDTRSVT